MKTQRLLKLDELNLVKLSSVLLTAVMGCAVNPEPPLGSASAALSESKESVAEEALEAEAAKEDFVVDEKEAEASADRFADYSKVPAHLRGHIKNYSVTIKTEKGDVIDIEAAETSDKEGQRRIDAKFVTTEGSGSTSIVFAKDSKDGRDLEVSYTVEGKETTRKRRFPEDNNPMALDARALVDSLGIMLLRRGPMPTAPADDSGGMATMSRTYVPGAGAPLEGDGCYGGDNRCGNSPLNGPSGYSWSGCVGVRAFGHCLGSYESYSVNWNKCCVAHDVEGYCGGTALEFLASNAKLTACMQNQINHASCTGVSCVLGWLLSEVTNAAYTALTNSVAGAWWPVPDNVQLLAFQVLPGVNPGGLDSFNPIAKYNARKESCLCGGTRPTKTCPSSVVASSCSTGYAVNACTSPIYSESAYGINPDSPGIQPAAWTCEPTGGTTTPGSGGGLCPGTTITFCYAGSVVICSNNSLSTPVACPSGKHCSGGQCITDGTTNPGTGSCFLAGTPIRMADGSTKAIDQIVPGDQVLSADPSTGEIKPQFVSFTHVHVNPREPIVAINESLFATANHRFYSNGAWTRAENLSTSSLLTDRFGATTTLSSIRLLSDRPSAVYNLTVENFHTYFAADYLVHNAAPKGDSDSEEIDTGAGDTR